MVEDDAATLIASLPPTTPVVPASTACVPQLTILQRRADFLRAASARRQGTAGFLLQARRRGLGEPGAVPSGGAGGSDADGSGIGGSPAIRVGFTCSRKLGNAVVRNRAKRRLRALAREIMPQAGRAGWDYVLVGRPEATVTRDFAALRSDLVGALDRIHAAADRGDAGPVAAPRRRGRG